MVHGFSIFAECRAKARLMNIIFCVKQKTAYDVRISDWSSDVCSSDLPPAGEGARRADEGARAQRSVLLVFLTGAQGQRAARPARPSSDASRHLLPQAGAGLGSGL